MRPSGLVERGYDSTIATSLGHGLVHRPGTGEPAPLRGSACVLRRGADPRPGRRPVRLHPLGHGEPGPRAPSWTAGPVRPTTQARTGAGSRTGQGPGPGPSDRATPVSYTHLRAHETDSYLV